MVNASLNWASIVGIGLMVVGSVRFFLYPKLSRNKYDLLFSLTAWTSGLILFFQGWRLDPSLQFGQFLLATCSVLLAFENINLRKYLFKVRRSYRDKCPNGFLEFQKNTIFEDELIGIKTSTEKNDDWGDAEQLDDSFENNQRTNNSNNESRRSPDMKTEKEKRFSRNIGSYKHEDLELMEDNQVYEIVKLQLLGITTGSIKPELGEVEYLKDILKTLRVDY